jgi:hypothetical protein
MGGMWGGAPPGPAVNIKGIVRLEFTAILVV